MNSFSNFQPRQILCLEHEDGCLYVEVVQVVAARQQCWVRPLVLTIAPPEEVELATTPPLLYDLRQGADLLWSTACFRAALDTEVLPLLAQIGDDKEQLDSDRLAHQQFQAFMQRVWQAHTDKSQS